MTRTLALVIVGLLVACSPQPESNGTEDAGMTAEDAAAPDAGSDASGDDSGSTDDSGAQTDSAVPDAAPDADGTANTELDVTVTVGETEQQFDRAFYGLTSPDRSASGDWELHVEAYAGGASGCPEMDSPTPDVTLIIGGLRFPEVPTEQREEDGVSVAVLDFSGELFEEPAVQATGEVIYFQQWGLCTDCEGDDPDGYLSFDVDARLEGGRVAGHVYATHCASLNSI